MIDGGDRTLLIVVYNSRWSSPDRVVLGMIIDLRLEEARELVESFGDRPVSVDLIDLLRETANIRLVAEMHGDSVLASKVIDGLRSWAARCGFDCVVHGAL